MKSKRFLSEWRLRTVLGLCAFSTALFFILSLAVVFLKTGTAESLEKDIKNRYFPELIAADSMIRGITSSLTALRGYIILGTESFQAQRRLAWDLEILPSWEKLVASSTPASLVSEKREEIDADLRDLYRSTGAYRELSSQPEEPSRSRVV